jgi:toxin YoeB
VNNISFTSEAWQDYLYWQTQDKKTLKRINQLLQDIIRNGYEGIGKPEPLKNEFQGFWSRRIDETNRMIYKIENDQITITQCRTHYGDK